MKIEMGESLIYSWLRHVRLCQIVQTNWKVSSQWPLHHETELRGLMEAASHTFEEMRGYRIFKKNASLGQILQQGECDLIGYAANNGKFDVCAVDVAFHEFGLQYGTRQETVSKILAKTVRTALCLYGYINTKEGEVLFASPKINRSVMNDVIPCVEELNRLFASMGFSYKARVVANDEFNQEILQPVLGLSSDVADTSELFLRSYQMLKMFK